MIEMVTEWTKLPPELQMAVVERCDFISRASLRSTSISMNLLAENAKLLIPCIFLKERTNGIKLIFTFGSWRERSLKFERELDGSGTRIRQTGREDVVVEGKEPEDVAVDMFRRVCCKTNVTIRNLMIETVSNTENPLALKFQKMFEESETPLLKFHAIFWRRMGQSQQLFDLLLNNCQPSLLYAIRVSGDAEGVVDVSTNHRDLVNKLDTVEIRSHASASDDDVLALKATKIHLTSEKFTIGLVEKLLEQLMERDVDDSHFILKYPDGVDLLETVPKGFEKIENLSKRVSVFNKILTDGQRRVFLCTGPYGVFAEIRKPPQFDFSGGFREECLRSAECLCVRYFSPYEDDESEYDDYEEGDELSEDGFGNDQRFVWSDDDEDSLDEEDYDSDY